MSAPKAACTAAWPDTRSARDTILGALRAAAPPALPAPSMAAFQEGPFGAGVTGPHAATLADRFEKSARGWRADVLRCGPDDWPAAVRAALDARACRRVALGAASPLRRALHPALDGLEVRGLDEPLESWKAELFDAVDAGITATIAGIADTGTLLLRPGPAEPRTLSLVPPVHVAVLRASTMHSSLAAALRALAPDRDMPTNLLAISGPSKTADIQQTLAYGAHGPKQLIIVLINDLGEAVGEVAGAGAAA